MKIIRALRTVNYRLWFAIFTTMLLPTVYQTVRIFFLGDMPSDSGINIASQLQWVNLFYEVVQEALILPLFFLLGKSIDNRDEFANKVSRINSNSYYLRNGFRHRHALCPSIGRPHGAGYCFVRRHRDVCALGNGRSSFFYALAVYDDRSCYLKKG